MRVFSKLICALVMVAGFAGEVAAKPAIYTCNIPGERQSSLIQPQVILSYDDQTKQVFVSDAVILSMLGKPLAGKMISDNALRVVFGWTLKNVVNAEGKTATLQFKGSYFKADSKFLISLMPLGYSNSFQNRGSCSVK